MLFCHLNVSLATQWLSHSVASGICMMVYMKHMPDQAMTTAIFCEIFDQLFNSFNSHSLRSDKPWGHPMSSGHLSFLREKQAWFDRLKINNKTGNLPCLDGWKMAIPCLIQLWEDLEDNHDLGFLQTGRLNQDCLENLFSIIRGKGGHRYDIPFYNISIV